MTAFLTRTVMKLILAVVLSFSFLPGAADAQTCAANIVGGSSFTTIQAAINAAATGATILVSSG